MRSRRSRKKYHKICKKVWGTGATDPIGSLLEGRAGTNPFGSRWKRGSQRTQVAVLLADRA